MLKKRQKYTALLDLILYFFSNRIPNCDLTCSMENVEFDCFLSFTRHVWWKCRTPYRTILKGKDCMTRIVCRQENGRWVLVYCGDSWPYSAHVVVAVGVQDRQDSQLLVFVPFVPRRSILFCKQITQFVKMGITQPCELKAQFYSKRSFQ